MRILITFIIISLVLSACTRNSGTARDGDKSRNKIGKQVISIAEDYAFTQVKDEKKVTDSNGNIIIGDEQKRIIIDPSKIFTGLIDGDSSKDAIISISPYEGQYEVMNQHLIIIEKDGKLSLERVLESDMRILEIKDGMIIADVPEHSRNTPLFNCPSCWEVKKFQLRNGELLEME